MDETRPWIARALSSLLALATAAGLFTAASFLVAASMPLIRHGHLPKAGGTIFFVSVTTSMMGAAVALVQARRRRHVQTEPEFAPLPRSGLPKAG